MKNIRELRIQRVVNKTLGRKRLLAQKNKIAEANAKGQGRRNQRRQKNNATERISYMAKKTHGLRLIKGYLCNLFMLSGNYASKHGRYKPHCLSCRSFFLWVTRNSPFTVLQTRINQRSHWIWSRDHQYHVNTAYIFIQRTTYTWHDFIIRAGIFI